MDIKRYYGVELIQSSELSWKQLIEVDIISYVDDY